MVTGVQTCALPIYPACDFSTWEPGEVVPVNHDGAPAGAEGPVQGKKESSLPRTVRTHHPDDLTRLSGQVGPHEHHPAATGHAELIGLNHLFAVFSASVATPSTESTFGGSVSTNGITTRWSLTTALSCSAPLKDLKV